jgi:hypothetical protein
MATRDKPASPNKVGWRPGEWSRDVGMSRAHVYRLLADEVIQSISVSPRMRIITTSPQEYLDSLRERAA